VADCTYYLSPFFLPLLVNLILTIRLMHLAGGKHTERREAGLSVISGASDETAKEVKF
jgi:hypothetical protein